MLIVHRLFFAAIAGSGGFILFRIIPVIAALITEKPILSIPLSSGSADFHLSSPGDFAVWQKVRGFRRTRIDISEPVIREMRSGRQVPLRRTAGMITANDGSGTRRQLYRFSVPDAGTYRLELIPFTTSPANSDAQPPSGEPNGVSIEIRKPMPVLKLIFCILGIIGAFGMLVGGLIVLLQSGQNH